MYWFSRGGPTAAGRIYYEMTGGQTHPPLTGSKWQSIPLGVSYFPAEISQLPKSCVPPRPLAPFLLNRSLTCTGATRWSHMIGNVMFESSHDKGGHFAAFEQPEKLAGDLRKMYGKGGPAHGVVPGKNGYD